jgi:GMP synthase-like glutamine amidotransferase
VKLLVIDPSIAFPEDEGVREVVGDWAGEVKVLQPGLRPGDGPTLGDGYDWAGVVLMGSRASVYDDLPWLPPLLRWLDPILEGSAPIPLLGICFGQQIIAHRRGSKIGFVHQDRKQELGVQETVLEGSRLVPDLDRMRVVVSHNEEVKDVPAGYRVVAARPGIPIDGIEHERLPIFAYQFHPEARREFLSERKVDLAGLDEDAVAKMNRLLAAFRKVAASRP